MEDEVLLRIYDESEEPPIGFITSREYAIGVAGLARFIDRNTQHAAGALAFEDPESGDTVRLYVEITGHGELH